MANTTTVPAVRERVKGLLERLNTHLYEKEKVIGLAFLSAIAGESIFLLGPPGVAKSMAARRLKFAFENAKSFEYLMGKFSTPDEVFGPVSISKLKNEDKYERLTDKYLPGANIVFLDEIWKASPPIQNSLLTVLNEKIYRNGEQEFRVDIRGLISASNELPLKGEGLEAIWDRFLIRLIVGGIESEDLFNEMITLPNIKQKKELVEDELKITDQEYSSWQQQIDGVDIPVHILGLIGHLRRTIRQRNLTAESDGQMYISDRRWKKITQLLRTSAFLHDRSAVIVMDCFLIQDCIWDRADQVKEAYDLVLGSIANYGYRRLIDFNPILEEHDALRKEILEATQIVQRELVPVRKIYKDTKGEIFHRVANFWGDTDAFLRKSDFPKIEKDGKAYVPIFEATGKSYRPFQTAEILLTDTFTIINKGRELPIETVEEEQETIIPKKPSAGMIKIWDSQVKLLLDRCEKNVQLLEKQKQKDTPHIQSHLFVDVSFAEHVLDSLNKSINDLLNLRLDIQKTKHEYESMDED